MVAGVKLITEMRRRKKDSARAIAGWVAPTEITLPGAGALAAAGRGDFLIQH